MFGFEIGRVGESVIHFDARLATVVYRELGESYFYPLAVRGLHPENKEFTRSQNRLSVIGQRK